MSLKSKDIPYTTYFKKLHVLLYSLLWNVRQSNIDIGVRKVLFINLWDRFENENECFYADITLIRIECIKLPESAHLVAIPVKNTDQLIYVFLKIKITITVKKCKKYIHFY